MGFFILPFAAPPMNDLVFVWDFHEQNPIITQFVTRETINAFCGTNTAKKKVFIHSCVILKYLVQSDMKILYV
jgi:hypothetical protein